MSKVIIVSRHFPSYHPRKGEPTNFVRSIWEGLDMLNLNFDNWDEMLEEDAKSYYEKKTYSPKWHTVRNGKRWKVGDWASLRVWSGKPYRSKQIEIAPPVEIKKIWKVKMEGYFIWLDGKKFNQLMLGNDAQELAMNDGLSLKDFWNWFPHKPGKIFEGQVICWNEKIEYL